jgi:hypothetical protein
MHRTPASSIARLDATVGSSGVHAARVARAPARVLRRRCHTLRPACECDGVSTTASTTTTTCSSSSGGGGTPACSGPRFGRRALLRVAVGTAAVAAALGGAPGGLWAPPPARAEAAMLVGPASAGGKFPTISAAVEAAGPGSTITVLPGRYEERIVVEGKFLTIQSAQVGRLWARERNGGAACCSRSGCMQGRLCTQGCGRRGHARSRAVSDWAAAAGAPPEAAPTTRRPAAGRSRPALGPCPPSHALEPAGAQHRLHLPWPSHLWRPSLHPTALHCPPATTTPPPPATSRRRPRSPAAWRWSGRAPSPMNTR